LPDISPWFCREKSVQAAPYLTCLFIEQFSKFVAELFIAEIPVYAGAGFFDRLEIISIGQDTWVQGPFCTAPWLAGVDCTSVVIEYTVSLNSDHLDGIGGLPPVFPGNLCPAHAKMFYHSLLVRPVQGNRGFPLAAIPALLTNKNI
jgi:hypothetical protein